MELADKIIKAVPVLVYTLTAFGFFIRILVDHHVIETIYFYHNDRKHVVTTDDPASQTFVYVFACAIISILSYSASPQHIEDANKILDCIFIPVLLRALVHLNDPITVVLFVLVYAGFQIMQRLTVTHGDAVQPSRLWRGHLWSQFAAVWATYLTGMIYNWDSNRPGGLAAQIASLVVCVHDFTSARRAIGNIRLGVDRESLVLCAVRFILVVCALVETV